MKKTLLLVMALFVVSLLGNATQAYGMEMSAEQTELWNRVQRAWEIIKKGDEEALKAGLSKEIAFWGYASARPHNSERYVSVMKQWFLGIVASYELFPFAIEISGNVGIALYGWNIVMKSGRSISARSAITFIKQNGEWKFFGGMSSSCAKPPPCIF